MSDEKKRLTWKPGDGRVVRKEDAPPPPVDYEQAWEQAPVPNVSAPATKPKQ